MYDSPIDLYISDIHHQILEQQDEQIYKAVVHFFPDVKRDELLKALQYDRGQYEKGYADGKRDAMDELVRCKDCKHFYREQCYHTRHDHHTQAIKQMLDDFCSYGERKDGEG